jgi:patatin-like phospholipase/acyl hydrolase
MSYKILSLDGGGSWALIQARVLKDIYGDIRGHELLGKFEMAISNSGGSLVLASLCNDMMLSEIIALFETKELRKQVFSQLTFWEKLNLRNIASLTNALGPKYSAKRKLEGLINVLKKADHLFAEKKISKPIIETPLNELPAIINSPNLQLIIVGFDYFRERVSFFRSNPNSYTDVFSKGKYYQVSLAHAIHSSSNAPINYFDAPAETSINLLNGNDRRTSWYWDGAVSGFNNPVLAGLIEAMTNNHNNPQDYCILSLGTGTGSKAILTDYKSSTNPQVKAIYERNKNNNFVITDPSFNFIKDIKKMSTSILSDPPDSATFIAYSILDPAFTNNANLIRINPCIKPERDNTGLYDVPPVYKNDSEGRTKFKRLMEMDMDAVEDEEVKLISELCDKFIVTDNSPALSNQLIRGEASPGAVYLGQPNYKEAKDKWMNCI